MANRKDFEDFGQATEPVGTEVTGYSYVSVPQTEAGYGWSVGKTDVGNAPQHPSPIKLDDLATEPISNTNQAEREDVTVPMDPIDPEGKNIATVGWLVSVKGACVGQDFRLHSGWNYVGRGSGVDVRIPDSKVSMGGIIRIGFVSDERMFYVVPCENARNIAKRNGKSILSLQELEAYDRIIVGDTELVFVPLCSEKFTWEE